jgi:hypothetical protein
MCASSVLISVNAILASMERSPLNLDRRGRPLRLASVAAALCLGLSPAFGSAATPAAQLADAPAASPGAMAKPPSGAPAAVPASDAAAKHAKRTACLKDAKTKKLVGADKTAFLKNCIAAP